MRGQGKAVTLSHLDVIAGRPFRVRQDPNKTHDIIISTIRRGTKETINPVYSICISLSL